MSYAPYPAYKENKIPWLGAIPDGWGIKAIRYIGKPIIGLTYSPTDVVGKNEGTLVLRASNIQKGKISLHDNVYVSSGVPEKLRIKAGDILVCSRNGSRHLIGKNALIEEDHDDWSFGAFTTVIRSEYGPFLYWVMNSKMFEYQSGRFLTTTINQLTTGVLNTFEIPFPPIEEQTAIADFLDKKTAEIDDLIAKKEDLLRLLAEQRSTLITHAVTKGINPSAPMKPSGVVWVGDVPERWEVKRVRNMADVLSSNVDKKTIDGEIPVRLCNYVDVYYHDKITDQINFMAATATPSEIDRFSLRAGDVVITKDSESADDIGVPALITNQAGDIVCGYHLAVFRGDPYYVHGPYMFYAIKGEPSARQFEVSANGVTRFGLSYAALKSLALPLPPIEEQTAIADFLDEKTAEIDDLIAKKEELLRLLAEQRSALITHAVTGKIKVA